MVHCAAVCPESSVTLIEVSVFTFVCVVCTLGQCTWQYPMREFCAKQTRANPGSRYDYVIK